MTRRACATASDEKTQLRILIFPNADYLNADYLASWNAAWFGTLSSIEPHADAACSAHASVRLAIDDPLKEKGPAKWPALQLCVSQLL
jgi:hypothetical protein